MRSVGIAAFLLFAVTASCQTIGSGVTVGSGVTIGFAPPPVGNSLLTVTETGTGGGTVTSSPAGINCGSTCAANFTTGTAVTLTATPQTNSTFDGWSGACSGTGTCALTMSSNLTATALFTDHTPASGLTFSPAAGTYTGAQTVTVTQSFGTGNSIFCTTDGSNASAASPLYNGPITVSASETLNCMVEKVGSVRQEMQNMAVTNTSAGWKICVASGGSNIGTPHANPSCTGGVGTDLPSGWNVTTGSTETVTVSSTAAAPQILVVAGDNSCDSCTEMTMDKWVKPTASTNGTAENHEMDALHVDHTRNRHHAVSLQCNQQSGTLQWQYDNQQGSWQNSGITDGCPLSTTLWTHVIWHGHWIIGDDGCGDGHSPSVHGGNGCTYFDWLEVGTATSPSAGAVMTHHALNATLENDITGWAGDCSDQDQVDLRGGGTYPKTAGIQVQHNNVTCGFGTQTTGSASYTIH